MRNVTKYLMILLVSVSMCFVLSGTALAELPDVDLDGYASDVDCDDNNPDVNPGATEICNSIDDNCDGNVDGTDADDDGWLSACDNCPNTYNPDQGESDGSVPGMRGYWKFEEGLGFVAYDTVLMNDGSINNADWEPPEGWYDAVDNPDGIVQSPVNGALWFKGAQRSDITILDDSGNMSIVAPTIDEGITVEVWVYGNSAIDRYAPEWSTIGIKSSYAAPYWYNNDGYGLFYQPADDGIGNGHMAFFINHYDDNNAYSANFTKDVWHHVAGTYDGQNIRIYVDGVEGVSHPYTEVLVDALYPKYFSISGT